MFREGLANTLRTQPDFEIVGEAGTIQAGIELARQLKPDWVLMDFNLPDGTGAEATETILRERPETIVIFLTVFDTDDYLFPAIRSGAKGYLLKSQSSAELLAALRKIEKNEAAISGSMTKRILDEFSRVGSPHEPNQSKLEELTLREFEILKELSTGATNRQIAQRLSTSESTIKNHVHNILSKLELKNRREVAWFARHQGLWGTDQKK
jgi:DNA-binding NarL/FixJ family response regulator